MFCSSRCVAKLCRKVCSETRLSIPAIWAAAWLGRRGWERWQSWRRPDEFDPVRRAAGKWLVRLREAGSADSMEPDRVVVTDLQRLRYGRRETWPEPVGVFRRARQAGKPRRR